MKQDTHRSIQINQENDFEIKNALRYIKIAICVKNVKILFFYNSIRFSGTLLLGDLFHVELLLLLL